MSITTSDILDDEPSGEGFAMFSDMTLRSVLSSQYCCLHCVDEETEGLAGDACDLTNKHTQLQSRGTVFRFSGDLCSGPILLLVTTGMELALWPSHQELWRKDICEAGGQRRKVLLRQMGS